MRIETKAKLDYLQETKSLIKTALNEKGIAISDSDTFRSYADSIRNAELKSDDVRYVTFMNGEATLYVKPVATGDDCVDVLTKGLITTPKKESTVDKVFTYSGWAATDGGAVNANVLKAVTEDKTVYAAYTDSPRYYTITYYDSDGTTVLKTESLAYGSMPNYAPQKDGHNFDGWSPNLATVTGDASYTVKWTEKLTFAGATWADIVKVAESGEAKNHFKVGDTRELVYKQANGTETTATVFILGFDHDDLADGSGKAGISMMINSTADGYTCSIAPAGFDNSNGGWKGSPMQKALNNDLFGTLPSALQSGIKQVTKISRMYMNGTDTTGTVTTQDKIWIPSVGEAGQTGVISGYGVSGGDGTKYAGLSITTMKGMLNSSVNYGNAMFRSASYKSARNFITITNNGLNSVAAMSQFNNNLVFGFCI